MGNDDFKISKEDLQKLEMISRYYKLNADIEENRYRAQYYKIKYFELITGLNEMAKKLEKEENEKTEVSKESSEQ